MVPAYLVISLARSRRADGVFETMSLVPAAGPRTAPQR
jgi:hypothetical protein